MPANDPPVDASAIGSAVRMELHRARVSARQLARDLGWSRTYVLRRMSGELSFTAVELHAIAGYLGVAPRLLFSPVPETAGAAK